MVASAFAVIPGVVEAYPRWFSWLPMNVQHSLGLTAKALQALSEGHDIAEFPSLNSRAALLPMILTVNFLMYGLAIFGMLLYDGWPEDKNGYLNVGIIPFFILIPVCLVCGLAIGLLLGPQGTVWSALLAFQSVFWIAVVLAIVPVALVGDVSDTVSREKNVFVAVGAVIIFTLIPALMSASAVVIWFNLIVLR